MVLVRKGYGGPNTKLMGPFKVVKLATKEGVLKTIGYTTENGAMEIAAIANVIPYLERRDETARESVVGRCEDGPIWWEQGEDKEEE
ncbi:hypothetical protein HPB52_023991 [Rhipicephalus sanguineus]|uniref:Uncharacterized protein n=1 Tax=Rhipicephalus sanguineus TaxID=34632 RepID=A0A9D4Q3F3_RHISA|nr:hypothetical protein HPB52_023991 [Rhipicephalus sanguineus]